MRLKCDVYSNQGRVIQNPINAHANPGLTLTFIRVQLLIDEDSSNRFLSLSIDSDFSLPLA